MAILDSDQANGASANGFTGGNSRVSLVGQTGSEGLSPSRPPQARAVAASGATPAKNGVSSLASAEARNDALRPAQDTHSASMTPSKRSYASSATSASPQKRRKGRRVVPSEVIDLCSSDEEDGTRQNGVVTAYDTFRSISRSAPIRIGTTGEPPRNVTPLPTTQSPNALVNGLGSTAHVSPTPAPKRPVSTVSIERSAALPTASTATSVPHASSSQSSARMTQTGAAEKSMQERPRGELQTSPSSPFDQTFAVAQAIVDSITEIRIGTPSTPKGSRSDATASSGSSNPGALRAMDRPSTSSPTGTQASGKVASPNPRGLQGAGSTYKGSKALEYSFSPDGNGYSTPKSIQQSKPQAPTTSSRRTSAAGSSPTKPRQARRVLSSVVIPSTGINNNVKLPTPSAAAPATGHKSVSSVKIPPGNMNESGKANSSSASKTPSRPSTPTSSLSPAQSPSSKLKDEMPNGKHVEGSTSKTPIRASSTAEPSADVNAGPSNASSLGALSIKNSIPRTKSRLYMSYVPAHSPNSPATPSSDVVTPQPVKTSSAVEGDSTSGSGVWIARPSLPFLSDAIAALDRNDGYGGRTGYSRRIIDHVNMVFTGTYYGRRIDEACSTQYWLSSFNPEYHLTIIKTAVSSYKPLCSLSGDMPPVRRQPPPFLMRNVRAGLEGRTAILFPNLPRSVEIATKAARYDISDRRDYNSLRKQYEIYLDGMKGTREAEEMSNTARVSRTLALEFGELNFVDIRARRSIGCDDFVEGCPTSGSFSIGEQMLAFNMSLHKSASAKHSSSPRKLKLQRPVFLRKTGSTLGPSDQITIRMYGRDGKPWPRPSSAGLTPEWRVDQYPSLSHGMNMANLALGLTPTDQPLSKALGLTIRCRILIKNDYFSPMLPMPRSLKVGSAVGLSQIRIVYTAASTPDEVRAASQKVVDDWDRSLKGALCAFCPAGDLGSEEALYVHYEVVHSGQCGVDSIERIQSDEAVHLHLMIRHGAAMNMIYPELPSPSSVPQIGAPDIMSNEYGPALLDPAQSPAGQVMGVMDDRVESLLGIDVEESMNDIAENVDQVVKTMTKNLQTDFVPESDESSNQDLDTGETATPSVNTDGQSAAGTSDTALARIDNGAHLVEDQPQEQRPIADRFVKDILGQLSPKFQGPFRHTDKIMLENRFGLMQPYMSSRRNKYTEWSSRVVPNTALDLLPELDKLYDGGQMRFYMRKIEDEYIIFRNHVNFLHEAMGIADAKLTEKRQLLMITWNRWRQEKGTIVDARDDVAYLTGWLDKYGEVLRKANVEMETKEHLLMLRQDSLICGDALIRACKRLNEVMGIEVEASDEGG